MINDLREHLLELSEKLNDSLRYEYSFTTDVLTGGWPMMREQHVIRTDKYNPIFRLSLNQIYRLKVSDFVIKEVE